jgi:Enolase C-terminal domain-like
MNGSAPRSRLVAWRGTQIASKLITANLNCSETGNEDFMKSTRIQPDLTKCGGLSKGLRMGWMASDHCVLLVPHGWNTAVGVAADLALTTAGSDLLNIDVGVILLWPGPHRHDLVAARMRLLWSQRVFDGRPLRRIVLVWRNAIRARK